MDQVKGYEQLLARIDWNPLVVRFESPARDYLLREYIRFLSLKAAAADFYDTLLAPSTDILPVWLLHILDTAHYLQVCTAIAPGHFFHYDPHSRTLFDKQERAQSLYGEVWGAQELVSPESDSALSST